MMQAFEKLMIFHDQCLTRWAAAPDAIELREQEAWLLTEANHVANFLLWRTEDRARRDDQGPAWVYQAKREIDRLNQQRNDQVELLDEWFYEQLTPARPDECAVHSETPGMMIDRLSILSLKAFHMQLQTVRTEVEESHRALCRQKLAVIGSQRLQLQQCLSTLLADIQAKKRTYCVYRQFKMYNDPRLNPELYTRDL